MPELDPETKKNLNPEFARRVEATDPPRIDVLVQTEPGQAETVAQRLAGIQGVNVRTGLISQGRFIPATIPQEKIAEVANTEGVVNVHQDQRVGISQDSAAPGDGILRPVRDIPFLSPTKDPVRQALSNAIERWATTEDPYLGQVGISKVEVPRINFAQLPPGDPVQAFFSIGDFITGTNFTGQTFIPTSDSVALLLDDDTLADTSGRGTQVGVIDTGHTPTPAAGRTRLPRLESWVPGEPPFDYHGHGSWCTNTAVGGAAPSSYGEVRGVAPGASYGHFKALNTFPGFGKTSWIIKAMERANEWGADVISMSLGGAQQGPVDQDPLVQTVRDLSKEKKGVEEGSIFVIAAGNSGPDEWTIGSPGAAPWAITVGSWSMTDEAPAVWSSRGPQGDWYKDNQERFAGDRQTHGSTFIKPDVAAPGGGRETQAKADNKDEFLHQVETGWVEGLFDGVKDSRGLMHGTSCIPDTLVSTPTGPQRIGDINEGNDVFSVGDNRVEADEVTAVLDHGEQPVFRMETNTRRVELTEDHPVLTVDYEEVTYFEVPNLKEARRSAGLSQQLLAEESGVDVSAIKTYENQGHGVTESRLNRIHDALEAATERDVSDRRTVRYVCRECGYAFVGKNSARLKTKPRCTDCRTTNVEVETEAVPLEVEETHTKFHRNGLEWRMVGELDEGDPIVVVDELPEGAMETESPFDKDVPSEDAMWLLGAYMGDGWTGESVVEVAFPEDGKPRGMLIEKASRLFDLSSISCREDRVRLFGKDIVDWIERSGIGHGATEKSIPRWIHTQPREQKVAFVRGYAEADGHLNSQGQLVFECANEDLMRGMKHLLDGMGFRTGNVRYRKRSNPWKKRRGSQPGHKDTAESWTLRVMGAETVKEIMGESPVTPTREVSGLHRESRGLELPEGVRLDRIQSIEYAGEKEVMDIETTRNHNFLAENTVTHNSQATPHVAGFVARLYEGGFIRTAAEFKEVMRGQAIPEFAEAHPTAREAVGGKNIAVGYGLVQSSLFATGTGSVQAVAGESGSGESAF